MVNDIKFWCTKEYHDFYHGEFLKTKVDIQVCAIEDLVEHELMGNLAEATQQFKTYMEEVNFPHFDSVENRVAFKDGFSLFLLLTQAGYFLDTNIFPFKEQQACDFSGEKQFTTGYCQGMVCKNDFYLMYSPVAEDSTALQIFRKWIKKPDLAHNGVFYDFNIPIFIRASGELGYPKLGVNKISYKSYEDRSQSRHFYWLSPDTVDFFAEKRAYVNINRQSQSCNLFLLETCSLHYSKSTQVDQLLSLPIETDTAYVTSDSLTEIFYVRLKEKQVICVADKFSSIQDYYFPRYYSPKPVTDPVIVTRVVSVLTQNKNHLPVAKLYHPQYIINQKNATYLHEAVLLQREDMVQTLLSDGANTDLRATYRIMPDNQCIEVTAEELAKYLNYSAIEDIFANHSMVILPENKGFIGKI
ncbi:MAG TPA: hypothetical protein PK657_13425 [Legionella sp.]|nr:hypothetical protein [Legionella sp.]